MGPLDRAEVLPRTGEVGSKPFELFKVEGGQHLQPLGALFGELQPDHPMVVFIPGPLNKTSGVSTVDETDRTVVQKQ